MAICCFFRWIKEMLSLSRRDDSVTNEEAEWISVTLNGAFSHAVSNKKHVRQISFFGIIEKLGGGIGFAGAASLPMVKSGVSPAGYSFHGLFALLLTSRISALTQKSRFTGFCGHLIKIIERYFTYSLLSTTLTLYLIILGGYHLSADIHSS
jgi:hypothetical protein